MGTGVGCAAVVVLCLFLVTTGFVTGAVNVSTEGLIVTDSGYPGGSVTIIEVLKNKGDTSSESEKVTYYLVNESEQNATPVQIGTADLTPISANGDYLECEHLSTPDESRRRSVYICQRGHGN